MKIIIETQRLLLRTFTIDDAQLIYELNTDPDVTKFTGDSVRDITQANEVLAKSIIPQYEKYGHGRWAVLVKPGLEFIGWCGLKSRPERSEVDLGYRFKKDSWGRGYATESARACLDHGFKKLHLPRIVGRAMPENIASWRVLEKIGMQYIGEEFIDHHMARTYEAFHPPVP